MKKELKKKIKNKSDKWSKRFNNFKIGLWNPWSYSNERHQYCKSLGYDILGLTELHNKQKIKECMGKRWTTSALAEEQGGKSLDQAAGVVILLSERMANNVIGRGHVGSRIVWVRIAGPICNLFVIITYIPHKGRKTAPTATDTIEQLKSLLRTVPKSDCVILGGDMNCQLQRDVPRCTGKWSMTVKPDNGHGEEFLELMRLHDLFAVDTLFKSRRKKWGEKKCLCNATYIDKDEKRRPRKLDYICVSNRWKSMVKNVQVRWGPSQYRFGRSFDHGFVSAIWHWRTRRPTRFRTEDFKAMTDQSWRKFDDCLRIKIEERKEKWPVTPGHAERDVEDDTFDEQRAGTEFSALTESIQEATRETVPSKKKLFRNGREVSQETHDIFEQRKVAYMQKKPTLPGRKEKVEQKNC